MPHQPDNKASNRSRRLFLWAWLLFLVIWPCKAGGLPQKPINQVTQLEEAEQLHNQGLKLYGEGKYDEALDLAIRELAIREK